MKVIDPGHTYALDHLESDKYETLTFIKRSSGAIEHDDPPTKQHGTEPDIPFTEHDIQSKPVGSDGHVLC